MPLSLCLISFVQSTKCEFMTHPLETHWITVKRGFLDTSKTPLITGICSLLYGTPSLEVFCDADWASGHDDRMSSSGEILLVHYPILHSITKHMEIDLLVRKGLG